MPSEIIWDEPSKDIVWDSEPKGSFLSRTVTAPLAGMAKGVNTSAGAMLDAFGFQQGAEAYKEGAAYWDKKATEAGSTGIPAKIYEGIGQAPLAVAEFVANVPYAGLKGAIQGFKEDGMTGAVKGALVESVKRYGIGKVFKAIEAANLTPVQKSAIMAGTMGTQTAAEGGSVQDVVAATATGAVLMPPTGGGRQSVVRQRMMKSGASPEVATDLSSRLPNYLPKVDIQNTEWDVMPDKPAGGIEPQTDGIVRNPERLSALTERDTVQPNTPYTTTWDANEPAVRPKTLDNRTTGELLNAVDLIRRVDPTLLRNPEALPAQTDSARQQNPAQQPVWDSNIPSEQTPVIDNRTRGELLNAVDLIKRVAPELLRNPEKTSPVTERDATAPKEPYGVVWDDPRYPGIRTNPTLGILPPSSTPSPVVENASQGKFGSPVVKPAEQAVPQVEGGIKWQSILDEMNNPLNNGSQVVKGKTGPATESDFTQNLASRYPSLFSAGKRYPKEAIKAAVKRMVEGKPLTENQKDIIRNISDDVNNMPPVKTEVSAMDLNVGDSMTINREKFKVTDITPDGIILKDGKPVELAHEQVFGIDEGSLVKGKAEAPDAAGLRQTVMPEVTVQPQTIGQVQPQGGRAVGTSELVDGFTPDPQPKLFHAGIPSPIEWAKDFFNRHLRKLEPGGSNTEAGLYKRFQDRNRKANADESAWTLEKAKEVAMRTIFDESGNVRMALDKAGPLGNAAKRAFDRLKGSGGKAMAAAEANDAIVKDFTLRERQILGDYDALNRELAIAQSRQGRDIDPYIHAGGMTPEQFIAAKAGFAKEYGLTPEQMTKIETAQKAISNRHRENVDSLFKAGIIDEAQTEALKKFDYSPKQFLQHLDPDVQIGGMGKRVSITDSGIERLKSGSDGYYRNNPLELLNEATARVQARVDKNAANIAVVEMINNAPDNGIAMAKIPGRDKPPTGWTSVGYMEGGKAKEFWMKDKYAKEWHQGDPLLNKTFVEIMQWVTGAKIVRALATGYNPAFLLTNVPRDLMTIWLQAEKAGYSKFAPKAIGEMAVDMKLVMKDAWLKTGRYEQFTKEGGSRERLTHEGAILDKRSYASPAIRKVQDVLSYVNNFSEILTRLAYRERLIKNGMDAQKATDVVAGYIDFARGGNVSRAIDQIGIPYLNAAVQGTRSISRAAYTDPAAFVVKIAQIGAATAGIYALNQMINPEGWASANDRDKASSFIIMMPPWMSYLDKNGDIVHPYIKIQKEQTARPLLTLVEAALQKGNEGKDVSKQVMMAFGDASINPIQLPPVGKVMYSYLTNTDFYTKERVWKSKLAIEPYAEYKETTPKAYVALGKAFTSTDKEGNVTGGLSPERMKGAISNIILPNNFYVESTVGMANAAWEKMSPSDKLDIQKTNYEMLRTVPGMKRIFGAANSMQETYAEVASQKSIENTKQFETNKKIDKMVAIYNQPGGNTEERYNAINSFIATLPESEQERVNKRIEQHTKIADLENKKWWLTVKAMTPERRAEQFVKQMKKVSPEKQQEMIDTAEYIDGFISDRFRNRYMELVPQ